MTVFKFIAKNPSGKELAGTGWFRASDPEITNGRGETAGKRPIRPSKQLDRDVCARGRARHPVHDPVTALLALGKSLARGHLPDRLRQHSSFDQTLSVMELPMPHNAKSEPHSEPATNGSGPDYNTLRAMRETRGYSVEELSLTCGLAVDEIEDIESGRVTDPSKLRRIVSALHLPQEALITPAAPPAAQGRSLA
ncbi:helix-turn-helix transcriptional regulator [Mesorhizobium sp. XAP10]|uniref:helix-turn-helix domain-containing protein n=1 Tax=unclassified Mesorhizobium TaxID=325217 RepID=UPI0023E002ED|nr:MULTISPECIES: helix-turn-helix transcriptional regulator [unclassified Mesorhizobium]MDF3155751.1 helix-turn-helix transcriptional regulator [Mesorhizobium sp. XAP10]MDF3248520.1 helix-turn-helix transcriptional regulator [Mesorhizobium sp. XAP4]